MATLECIRLIYDDQGTRYSWDIDVARANGTKNKDRIDLIAFTEDSLGVQRPCPPPSVPPGLTKCGGIRPGPAPKPPFSTPGGSPGPGQPPERGEHCVWIHLADCTWEMFCGSQPGDDGAPGGGDGT